MRSALMLVIVLFSLLMRSQSFVQNGVHYLGKTKKQIEQINKDNNSKFFSREKTGNIISVIYMDSINSLANHFIFSRHGLFGIGPWRCDSYLVNVGSKAQFEKNKSELLGRCDEKISERCAFQVSNSKKYVWLFLSSEKSDLYTLLIEPHIEGHKYH